ncbi:putative ribonuclease H-like domain-containing protein [Tanacetum coccineum]
MMRDHDARYLDAFMPVSHIPTTRIHKDHPVEQIIRDIHSAPQTRKMTNNLKEHGLLSSVQQRTNHKDFQNRTRKMKEVFLIKNKERLVAQGYTQEEGIDYDEMDVKSAFLYGKIEEEVYVCQLLRFEDPDFLTEDKCDIPLVQVYVDDIIFGSTKKSLCIDFKEMMHKKFQMSYMGELIFFLGLQVKQKEDGIFISQDKYVTEILKKFGFSDVKTASTPMETHKPLLKDADGEDVDEHLYRSMIGSLMYLTSSRPDIMFTDSPFNLVPYTNSDYAGASLDRKSTTGGCQFLGCRLISWQCKKQTVVANSTTEVEYIAASNCCGQKGIGVNAGNSKLMLLGINLLLLDKVNAARHNLLLLVFWDTVKAKTVNGEVQLQALVDKKKVIITESTIRRDLQLENAEGFSRIITPLFQTMMVQAQEEMGEGSANPTDPHHTPTITQPSTSQPKKKKPRRKQRKDTEVSQPSGPTEPMVDETENVESVPTHSNDLLLSGEDSLKLNELMELYTNLQKKVLDLETTKTIQALEIDSLKRKVKKLEKKQRLRIHKLRRLYKVGLSAKVVSSDDAASLGDQDDASKQERKILDIDADEDITLDNTHVDTDPDMFGVHDLHIEMTLAQTLIEIKSAKPKAKGIVMQEPSESTLTISSQQPSQVKGQGSKDKGKEKMIESEKPLKKKDQIMYDQEVGLNLQAQLQAELEEEERISRQKEEEANIALIESWDNHKE